MTIVAGSRPALALLYAAVVAGYPLISAVPLILGVDSRVATVPYRAAILLYSLVIIITVSIAQRRAYRGLFWLPFIIFWALYTMRLLLDIVFVPVLLRLSPIEYVAYSLGMCMMTGMVMLIRVDDETLRLALRYVSRALTAACLIALYLNVVAILSGDLSSLQHMRLQSETLNPVGLGNLGVSLVILSMFKLLQPAQRSGAGSVTLVILMLVGLATMGAAASRGPVLALALALPVLVFLGVRNGAWARALLLGGAVVTIGVSAAFYIQQTLGFGIITRIEAALNFRGDESSMERVRLFTNAWDQFLQNPILGSSLDERVSTFHPHNPLVESFMATGFLGGTAFVLMLGIAAAACLRILYRMPEHGWLTLLFGQYLLHALLSGSLYLSADMWGLMSGVVVVGFALVRPPATPAPALARPLHASHA